MVEGEKREHDRDVGRERVEGVQKEGVHLEERNGTIGQRRIEGSSNRSSRIDGIERI